MPVPRIAIVGRPNVGKSSLLNLIARQKVSIVDPTPGVTRDRVSAVVEIESPDNKTPPKRVEMTDTGGYGVYTAEGARYDEVGADLATLTADIEAQIGEAVANADLILFCVDCQAGITPQDIVIATMLREQKFGRAADTESEEGAGAPRAKKVKGTGSRRTVPVRVVATKADGPSWEPHAFELSALGFGEPMLVSAKTRYFRRDMLDTLYGLLPDTSDEPEPLADLRLAIVGKRNAGKSTLVNTLAGEPRVIVSEIAGTTRDAIDVKFEMDGRSIIAIDTAGLRRKRSFQSQIEWYALDRAERAIARADAVLMLIDAQDPVSQVDEQLAAMIVDSYKPVVVVVNKWDAVEGLADDKGRPATPERYEEYLRKELKGVAFAPIAFMSAKEGLNVRGVVDLALDLFKQASLRVGTGQINRVVRDIVDDRGPSNKLGIEARVYFASQVRTNPPTIVLVVNNPDFFTHNYERYLMNQLRERLPFGEVPIRLILRSRARVEKRAAEQAKGGRPGKGRLHTTDAATGGFDDELRSDAIDAAAMLEGLPDDAAAYFDD